MSFQDQIASDLTDVFLNTADFAESVTYTPVSGSPSTLDAVFEPYSGSIQRDEHLSTVQSARLHLANTISPAIGDTFTIDGLVWNFHGIESSDASGLVLELRRDVGAYAGGGR